MRNGLEMSSQLLVAGRLKSTLSRFFCERIWDFYLVRSLSVAFEFTGVEFFLRMNVENLGRDCYFFCLVIWHVLVAKMIWDRF